MKYENIYKNVLGKVCKDVYKRLCRVQKLLASSALEKDRGDPIWGELLSLKANLLVALLKPQLVFLDTLRRHDFAKDRHNTQRVSSVTKNTPRVREIGYESFGENNVLLRNYNNSVAFLSAFNHLADFRPADNQTFVPFHSKGVSGGALNFMDVAPNPRSTDVMRYILYLASLYGYPYARDVLNKYVSDLQAVLVQLANIRYAYVTSARSAGVAESVIQQQILPLEFSDYNVSAEMAYLRHILSRSLEDPSLIDNKDLQRKVDESTVNITDNLRKLLSNYRNSVAPVLVGVPANKTVDINWRVKPNKIKGILKPTPPLTSVPAGHTAGKNSPMRVTWPETMPQPTTAMAGHPVIYNNNKRTKSNKRETEPPAAYALQHVGILNNSPEAKQAGLLNASGKLIDKFEKEKLFRDFLARFDVSRVFEDEVTQCVRDDMYRVLEKYGVKTKNNPNAKKTALAGLPKDRYSDILRELFLDDTDNSMDCELLLYFVTDYLSPTTNFPTGLEVVANTLYNRFINGVDRPLEELQVIMLGPDGKSGISRELLMQNKGKSTLSVMIHELYEIFRYSPDLDAERLLRARNFLWDPLRSLFLQEDEKDVKKFEKKEPKVEEREFKVDEKDYKNFSVVYFNDSDFKKLCWACTFTIFYRFYKNIFLTLVEQTKLSFSLTGNEFDPYLPILSPLNIILYHISKADNTETRGTLQELYDQRNKEFEKEVDLQSQTICNTSDKPKQCQKLVPLYVKLIKKTCENDPKSMEEFSKVMNGLSLTPKQILDQKGQQMVEIYFYVLDSFFIPLKLVLVGDSFGDPYPQFLKTRGVNTPQGLMTVKRIQQDKYVTYKSAVNKILNIMDPKIKITAMEQDIIHKRMLKINQDLWSSADKLVIK